MQASRKFAGPFHGPYRIISAGANNAYIRRVDRRQDEPILVALQCLRRCPDEVADEFWPPDSRTKRVMSKPTHGGNAADVTKSVNIEKDIATVSVLPTTPPSPVPDVAHNKGKSTGASTEDN